MCVSQLFFGVCVCFLQLAPDDAWRCPHCKQLQQGRIKLSLWTLPDVLILHLKRFRQVLQLKSTETFSLFQVRMGWGALDQRHSFVFWFRLTFVQLLPIQDKKYMNNKTHFFFSADKQTHSRSWSSSVSATGGRSEGKDAEHDPIPADGDGHGATCGQKKPEQLEFALPLVSMETVLWPGKKPRWLPIRPVCCVQPSWQHARRPLYWWAWQPFDGLCVFLRFVHLNSFFFLLLFVSPAYCKNSIDGQWYCFDDSEVSPIADEEVCQQSAYILFYQRRSAIPSWSANSSVAGQLVMTSHFGWTCCVLALEL